MPALTPAAVRRQIAQHKADPVYLIIGDDEAEMSRLAADFGASVEDELRAFNVERMYASDKGVSAASIVESARMLPMLAERRVVVVLRAERLLKPKRRAKAGEEPVVESSRVEGPADGDALETYVRDPEPQTTLVLVATDADRSRRLYKALQKHATIVECWGLKSSAADPRNVKGWELGRIAKDAMSRVKRKVEEAGRTIEPAGAQLIALRAGTNVATLDADTDRLLLYVGHASHIRLADVRQVVSSETLQDHWALSGAIVDGKLREALRQLALALDAGTVPYVILGQLGDCVRRKMSTAHPERVRGAVEALFRTDLDLKSSGGDPRVLLERLVVELCGG